MVSGVISPSLEDGTLSAAMRGDQAAWAAIYRALGPGVVGYFRARRVRDAEDLAADVFLEVARRMGAFRGGADGFRSWVFTIAHSRYVDWVRAMQHRRTVPLDAIAEPAGGDDAFDGASDSLRREALISEVDALSPDQRSVVLLRMLADLSVTEVAEVLGKSESAVKVLHHRGVKALRRNVDPEAFRSSAAGGV